MPARKRVGLNLIVGGNVRRLRERANLSQAALARLSGVEQASISAVESGIRGASMLLVMNIASALKVPAVSLFKERKEI